MARRSTKHLLAALAVLTVGGWASAASALTCSLSAPGVAFGGYDPLNGADREGTGNINVSCDGVVTYSIALSTGAGSYSARSMSNGVSQMQYNLYTDTLRSNVWGDGSGGTSTVSGTGGDHAVYGLIPGGQNVTVGTYTDTVTVTVTY